MFIVMQQRQVTSEGGGHTAAPQYTLTTVAH